MVALSQFKNQAVLLLLLCVFILHSCNNSDEVDNTSSSDAERGYVTGVVLDARAQPIPGVSIIIDNTVFPNTYITTTTDDKGEYRAKLSSVGVWIAYAKYNVHYEGQEFSVYFNPNNADGFVSEDGVIRNFTWTLTGRRPEPLTGYFGGSIHVEKAVGSTLYDRDKILFTLSPTALLIDGYSGQTITTRCNADGRIDDIPIGKYRITAQYYSDDGVIPLKLNNFFTQGDFENALELTFSPSTHLCDNCMIIQYHE